MLAGKGRVCAVSFHSLEDRIVKQEFLAAKNKGAFRILTPKPLQSKTPELKSNIHSRSAKLRVIEKL